MEWNAELYRSKHAFVAEYGKGVVDLVPVDTEQTILDLGCGTGELTKVLADKAGKAIGVDGSAAMIELARKSFPEIEFHVRDARALGWSGRFDTVFSNAVFHWIPEQEELLRSVRDALKAGGKLICEFGAKGNIAKIQAAFVDTLVGFGHSHRDPFYFPDADEYRALLERSRFTPDSIAQFDRPTPLVGGESGLRNWLTQFYADDLRKLSREEQEALHRDVECRLRDELWDGGQWVADYRRIRVVATAG